MDDRPHGLRDDGLGRRQPGAARLRAGRVLPPPPDGAAGDRRHPLDRARPGPRRHPVLALRRPRPRRSPTCCRLARGMTYKHAAAGLDQGGGKAVIFGDPRRSAPRRLIRAYGRFVARPRRALPHRRGRRARPRPTWTSSGGRRPTSPASSPSLGGSGDPSPATAWGVLWAMRAAAERPLGLGRPGRPPRHGVRASARSGRALVDHLVEDGATRHGRRRPRRGGPGRARRPPRGRQRLHVVEPGAGPRRRVRRLRPVRARRRPRRDHHPRAALRGRRRLGQQPARRRPTTTTASPSAASSTSPTTWSTPAASSTSPRSRPATTGTGRGPAIAGIHDTVLAVLDLARAGGHPARRGRRPPRRGPHRGGRAGLAAAHRPSLSPRDRRSAGTSQRRPRCSSGTPERIQPTLRLRGDRGPWSVGHGDRVRTLRVRDRQPAPLERPRR